MKAKPHQFSSTLPTLSSKDHPPVAAHARQCFGVKRFVARRAALRDAGLSPKMELRILLSLPAFSTSCHVSAILLGLSAISGFAGDATWNGGTASWSTAAGWTTSPVGNYPKNGNAGQNWNATLNNGSAALDVEDILIQQFTLTGGTVTGSFNLSATGNLAWTGGGMAGAGTTSVAGTGSTISGSATRGLDRTLNNTGTMTNSMPDGAEPFYFGWKSAVTPGVLNNSGIFNLTAGGDFAHYNPNAGHAINNSGTWNISGAGTTSSVNPGIAFNNTGAVTAASGTFAMNGGGTSTGSFAASAGATLRFGGAHNLAAGSGVSGAGTVDFTSGTAGINGTYNVTGSSTFSGATVTFNAPIASLGNALNISSGAVNFNSTTPPVSAITLSGGVLGGSSASVSATGDLAWTGGAMAGAGATSVAGTGSTISGSATRGLDRTLNNTGTMTNSMPDGAEPFYFGWRSGANPGVLNNSGTFNLTAGGDFSEYNPNAGHAINNSGTWNISGAGTTSSVNPGIAFNNTAAVNVISGTLSLASTTVTQYTGTALTAGIWRVFSNAALKLPTSGTGIVTNQADIALSGVGSYIGAGASAATLENKLATNSGALRLLAGRNFTATSAVSNSGILEFGGGTFTGPELTNTASGEIFGFGTITLRPTNSGTIRSAGGVLEFSNGLLGGSGTVRIDAGSTMNLSAGAASGSSADFLIHNGSTEGSLNLGAKTFAVGIDYTNANFGTGNAFAPRANVSGSGGILAVGGTGQTLGGSVSSGATATPVMDFGKFHLGAATTLNYQINNTGASGSRLRGAIQTNINGGNLTDSRLTGAGVTAADFGPIPPAANSGNLPVTFTASSAGSLTGQAVRLLNNFDNVADQTLSFTGAAYRYAAPSAHSPEPVAFGNLHVGATAPARLLTLSNQAANDGFSESLNASIGGATGGVTTNGGSFNALAPGSSNGSSLSVGISTASAGSKNGSATISLNSNGTGSSDLGLTPLTPQTVTVTGAAYRYAAPSAHSPEPVAFGNIHVGATAPTQLLTLSNQAANDGFSESLNASIGGATGGVTTNGGSFNALAPGSSNGSSLSVGISTASAGSKNGSATISLNSNGTGSSALGLTALTPQTVTVTGSVYRLAQPVLPGGTSLDFGIVHVGDTAQKTITVNNTAANDGFSESLDGSFSGDTGHLTGSGSFAALAPGAASGAPKVTLDTSTAGSKSGTSTIALVSNGTGSSGLANTPLASQVISAIGQVNNYAVATFAKDSGAATFSGSGNAYTVSFGRRTIGETSPVVTLRVTNSAAGPADTLAGSFVSTEGRDFALTGFGDFSNIGAGQSQTGLNISLRTDRLGTFSQTITLNGLGQNTSGYSGALAPIIITLTGEVAPVPALQIRLVGANAVLSWPVAEQDWVLKKGNNLTGWTNVEAPVVDTKVMHTVTTPRGVEPKMYFRLEK